MAGERRSYEAEFCEGAVRIVLETGKKAAEVAREPDVHDGTLSGNRGPGPDGVNGPVVARVGLLTGCHGDPAANWPQVRALGRSPKAFRGPCPIPRSGPALRPWPW